MKRRLVFASLVSVAVLCAIRGAEAGATNTDVREFIADVPARTVRLPRECEALRSKLEAHVLEMIGKQPLAPFHFSNSYGRMFLFTESRRTLYALSIAYPFLEGGAKSRVRSFLASHYSKFHPLKIPYFTLAGRRRFPFEGAPMEDLKGNPQGLKEHYVARFSRTQPIYSGHALWAYGHYVGEWPRVLPNVPALESAFQMFARKEPKYEVKRRPCTDAEAELNRAINGITGFLRLAEKAGRAAPAAARGLLQELLARRVEIEGNPLLVHNIDSNAHDIAAAVRYIELSPELGRLLREHTDTKRTALWLDLIAELAPGWFLAWHEKYNYGLRNPLPPGKKDVLGDRDNRPTDVDIIEGEHLLMGPPFSYSLFLGRALVVGEDYSKLKRFVDIPWCVGDLYYIEKVVCALRNAVAKSRSFSPRSWFHLQDAPLGRGTPSK